MKQKIHAALEHFSRAMLLPLGYIAAAGLILMAGALLTNPTIAGVLPGPVVFLGGMLYQSVMLVIQNLSLLFCVGIAAATAQSGKHQAAIIALMAYLMYLTAGNATLVQLGRLAQPDPMLGLYGTGQTMVLGIQTTDMGVFGGVLLGFLIGAVYNRTCSRAGRGVLMQLLAGTRASFVCAALAAMLFGAASCFFWPPVQSLIGLLTRWIAQSGNVGLFVYGFLDRFLIPTGLHHLVYTPFQFTALGNSLTLGETTYHGSYAVLMMEYALGMDFSEGIVWMYTGFTKTFGYFGITAAFIACAAPQNRKKTAASLLPLAFTASIASITEPIDFLFCFLSPVLWAAHGCIAGLFLVLLRVFHVTGFTTNLISVLLLNLSAGAARTRYPILFLLGVLEAVVYFLVFTFLIRRLDIPTPGRRSGGEETQESRPDAAAQSEAVQKLLEGLGGAANIRSMDCCFTRLRVTLENKALLREELLNALPHKGIVRRGNEVQIVYGLQVASVKAAAEAEREAQLSRPAAAAL